MQSAPTQPRQPFIPLLATPRSRQPSASSSTSSSSIWAPQPQSPAITWPTEIGSFLQSAHHDIIRASQDVHGQGADDRPATKEDVFGIVDNSDTPLKRMIGAIGDGRSREFHSSDDHIEKLLRALNLHSPPPSGHPSSLNLDFDASPTSTSLSMTPPETSPVTPASSEFLFRHGYDLSSPMDGRGGPILHDHGTPMKSQTEHRWNDFSCAPFRSNQYPDQLQSPSFAAFPFSDEARSPMSLSHRLPTEFDPSLVFGRHAGTYNERSSSPLPSEGTYRFIQGGDFDPARVCEHPSAPDAFNVSPPVSSFSQYQQSMANEPINFLSLLHPSSTPPYSLFVARVVKSSDQQASIFLQQKLKVADAKERSKIVDAICTRGFEMMAHRFGNWAVQRCLEAASSADERRKIASCMRGRVVELAMNCYGCHVLQKALDCEEDIRLLIVSELLIGDPAQTLVNKHASHVWSKIMEISWTPPAPPIFAYVNKALQGEWASLACHETGSLVVQHAFENLEESAKDGIVDELLNQGSTIFGEVAKNQWGSYCIQHILEHGSPKHRELAISHILFGLLEYSTNEQGYKSVSKALKEGGKDVLDRFVKRMCEPPEGGRRAIIVDLALSATGSQLIASVLPNIDKDQRTTLYDALRGHIVTLRGCKTGSKVIWLFDRMRAYYGN
ncbi:ARM repeat-containing protein [Rickenella mellea]|uniref:ARM repeat-containing protein n=1 Tax=Rickenella mellea TaxID=50990 RepID=A0A4Y7QKX2_9AGAM|nr:ARM repeat-containing protein [Rickenella mellea]